MAVLSHVGKPLQAADTLFMTEWVAILRESGLRDDVSVENLREARLQLVVCARARARELQVDVPSWTKHYMPDFLFGELIR